MLLRFRVVVVCGALLGCGELSRAPEGQPPDGGQDDQGAARDAGSESSLSDVGFDAGPDTGPEAAADGAIDAGPSCGVLGAPCCPGATCIGSLACASGTCSCAGSSGCPGGGTCTSGRCLITQAGGQSGPYAIAVDRTSVYWTNEGFYGNPDTIVKAPLDGGTLTTLASFPSMSATGSDYLQNIAVSATTVYWSSFDGTIMSVPLDGGPARTFVAGSFADSMVIDASRVYWFNGYASSAQGSVMSATLAGASVTTLAGGYGGAWVAGAWAMAVDAQRVYWTTGYSGSAPLPASTVTSVPLAGGATSTLAQSNAVGFDALATDGDSLYVVAMYGTAALLKMPLAGGAMTTLASGQTDMGAIVVDATNVYWANGYDGTVMKVPTAGGTPTTLFHGDKPRGIAVDDRSVYWSSPSGGTVMRLSPK